MPNSINIDVSNNSPVIHINPTSSDASIRAQIVIEDDDVSVMTRDAAEPIAISEHDRDPFYVGAKAKVEQTEYGAVITCTDADGTTTAVITNGGGGGGTSNYNDLLNKPQIEGVTLVGDKSFPDLNLNVLSNSDIQNIFDNLL